MPCEGGGYDTGEALDEKEEAPGGNGNVLCQLEDSPSEGRGERCGEGGSGDEEACSEGEFLALEEEGEVEGNAGKASLADPEENSQDEEGVERGRYGLERGYETPRKDEDGDVDMCGDEFPQDAHPFEGDIGYIKCCENPFVLGRVEVQINVHACDLRISDILNQLSARHLGIGNSH